MDDWIPGACVLTPHGVAALHHYDLMRDLVFTNRGAFDAADVELVIRDLPDFSDLEAVDAWLRAGPQPDPVRPVAKTGNVRCITRVGCNCESCYRTITVRASGFKSSHFRDTACRCVEEGCRCC